MRKLASLLLGLALLGAMSAHIMAQDGDDKKETFAWHIIIKERDDVGLDVKTYREALSKAFKSFGDTVEDEATADNITLYIVIGKDDADDDNDGTPDAQDTDDYGDGFADNGESVTVYDMDKDPKFSAITGELSDENKTDGMYISITSEDGSENIYTTKADSFKPMSEDKKEGAASASPVERLFGHTVASKSLFAAPNQYPCAQSWDYLNCIKNYQAAQEQAQREREEAEKRAKVEAEAKAKADAEANKSKGWVTLLKSGQVLAKGAKVENPAGRFVFQDDGNIVLYDKANKVKWASGSVADWSDGTARELKMQPDGNLTVYLSAFISNEPKAFWNVGTGGNNLAYLQIEWALYRVRIVDKDGKLIKNLN